RPSSNFLKDSPVAKRWPSTPSGETTPFLPLSQAEWAFQLNCRLPGRRGHVRTVRSNPRFNGKKPERQNPGSHFRSGTPYSLRATSSPFTGTATMTTAPLTLILRHVRQLAGSAGTAPLSDPQLVERFVTTNDADAFAVLMERHGPMVLGVCRRALHNAQ